MDLALFQNGFGIDHMIIKDQKQYINCTMMKYGQAIYGRHMKLNKKCSEMKKTLKEDPLRVRKG